MLADAQRTICFMPRARAVAEKKLAVEGDLAFRARARFVVNDSKVPVHGVAVVFTLLLMRARADEAEASPANAVTFRIET